MKKTFSILLVLFLITMSCKNSTETTTSIDAPVFSIQEIWATDSIFNTPESVLYDSLRNQLFVANMNRDEEGETGYISKLNTDGSLIELKWMDGLKEPRGMGIFEGKLYVTDSDRLLVIDIEQGAMDTIVPIEGASFLNDLAIDAKGKVYISDSSTGKVHTYVDRHVSLWLDSIPRPNGLFIEKDRVLLNCVKSETLSAYTLQGEKSCVIADSIGRGDGVEFSGIENYYVVTDWAGQIHVVGKNFKQKVLDTREIQRNTADLAVNTTKQILYVPTFYDNRVIAFQLKSE